MPGLSLVDGGGQPVHVLRMTALDYDGEMYDIATSSSESVSGHLIEANGVIAGDHDLQVAIES